MSTIVGILAGSLLGILTAYSITFIYRRLLRELNADHVQKIKMQHWSPTTAEIRGIAIIVGLSVRTSMLCMKLSMIL